MSQKNQTILLSIIIFYAFALPLILLDYNAGRAFVDQDLGHLPAIRFFIDQFDFSDYPSATTPGYHVLMAFCAKTCSPDIIFLKLISSLITAFFIGIFAGLLHGRAGKRRTIWLLLPMIFSLYFFPDGVWLVPDNLAWLTVALLLILTATTSPGATYYLAAGLLLPLAVCIRQPNIWLASIPWAAGLSHLIFSNAAQRHKLLHCSMMLLITVPAFLVLFYFYTTWDGLVPPTVQGRHERAFSYSVPAFFLSIFFTYSIFYISFVIDAIKKKITPKACIWIITGGLLGFLAAVIPATDYNYEAGRFSGFWNFVRVAPVLGRNSILLTITSTLGGALFFSWLLLLKKQFRLILLLAALAFTAALIPNTLVLERYFAGFVFILIFIMLYLATDIDWQELPGSALLGPAIFTLINFLFLLRGLLPETIQP